MLNSSFKREIFFKFELAYSYPLVFFKSAHQTKFLIKKNSNSQIGVPRVKTVYIGNTGKETLILESISASSTHFYCSFLKDKVVAPGGNTSFEVYFLARELGPVHSSLYLNTNQGIVHYRVAGVGERNRYGLSPIKNVRIPINTSYTHVIQLHNPTRFPMQVLEIYASDDDLHLEIPAHFYVDLNDGSGRRTGDANRFDSSSSKKKNQQKSVFFTKTSLNAIHLSPTTSSNRKSGQDDKGEEATQSWTRKNLWHLQPFETRSVVLIRYLGHYPNNHTAFVCIRAVSFESPTKSSDNVSGVGDGDKLREENNDNALSEISFVLPIELEVTDRPGLFAFLEFVNFEYFTIRPSGFDSNFHTKFSSATLSSFNFSSLSPFLNDSFKVLNDFEKSVSLFLTNGVKQPVEVKEVSSVRQNTALAIGYIPNLVLPANVNQLTKVAEISFNRTFSCI